MRLDSSELGNESRVRPENPRSGRAMNIDGEIKIKGKS